MMKSVRLREYGTALVLVMFLQAASVHAVDWPQFRWPNRDGKSPEIGLLKVWPQAGPRLIRTISGVGGGFSSPSIAEGRIYITGKVGENLTIFCFDLSGKMIWKRTHGPAYNGETAPHSPYPGKGSIIYADDMLYCLGERGKMGLIEANPAAFKIVSLFGLPKGEGRCWTHPVISDGKLYLRWDDNLYVHDIKK